MFSISRSTTADLALDLGTTNTRVVVRGQGLVQEVPTVVAIQTGPQGREAAAVGEEARRMLGRTHAASVVRPLRGGTIAEFEATEHLLRHILQAALSRTSRSPRILISVPTSATDVERRALQESARAAGAREVHLVPACIAAAVGAQLPVFEPTGTMVVNVGGGRSEATVLSLGSMVVHKTVMASGDTFDRHIMQWLKRNQDLMVGEPTAERIKLEVGSATLPNHPQRIRIRGRDLSTGGPRTFDMDGSHVADAVSAPVLQIRDAVLATLAKTPPEISADIHASGVILCGDGARLPGLDSILSEASGLPFLLADGPGRCVAMGLAAALDDLELYERMAQQS